MEGIRNFGGGHRRAIVVAMTVLLLVLSGLTGIDQLLQPPMTATAQAATNLSKAVQANNDQIAAATAKLKTAAAGPQALTNHLNLKVDAARASTLSGGPKKGDAITKYHWLINLDNTGDPTQPSNQ